MTEELLSEIEEEELDDRRFEACEEIDRYAKERWDCENLLGGGCCSARALAAGKGGGWKDRARGEREDDRRLYAA